MKNSDTAWYAGSEKPINALLHKRMQIQLPIPNLTLAADDATSLTVEQEEAAVRIRDFVVESNLRNLSIQSDLQANSRT